MSKVFIGVGHGGSDPGAVANGLRESDVNLTMALAMKRELERHGVEVGISRTADTTVGLTKEISLCNAYKPDIAVEVHNNAGGGDGFEVYRQTNGYASKSTALAKNIEQQVLAIGQNSRGVKTKVQANGTDYFGWLRQLNCPAVLCEGAFLDNKIDMQAIDTKAEQETFGVAYAKAVLNYFGIVYKTESATDTANLTPITGNAELTTSQMRAYLKSKNPDAPDYSDIYFEEGEKENIRGDVAFAQSCLETGFWKFGGDVKIEQNNFCGLGATGGGEPGNSFKTAREGIRAQIQHLKAYANAESLVEACVDPRFKYVERGAAQYVEWLGIPDNPNKKGWAAGQNYGKKILEILAGISAVQVEAEPEAYDTTEIVRLREENSKLRSEIIELNAQVKELTMFKDKIERIREIIV